MDDTGQDYGSETVFGVEFGIRGWIVFTGEEEFLKASACALKINSHAV